jgi:phage baseplate assembly protein W
MAKATRFMEWPFHIGADGGVAMTEDAGRSAAQRITQLIHTRIGERVMLPDYGTAAGEFVFETSDEVVAAELGLRIQAAITQWEPDIRVSNVRVLNTGDWSTGEMVIEVMYSVTPSDTTFTTLVGMGGSIGASERV